jgi:N-methylhydantoinase A
MVFSIGVDIGGTFTDVVAINELGDIYVGKADTTPRDLTEGVVNALSEVASQIRISIQQMLKQTIFFGHGTTVGSNALITKRGAKVGLIITKGFEDEIILMIGVEFQSLQEFQ